MRVTGLGGTEKTAAQSVAGGSRLLRWLLLLAAMAAPLVGGAQPAQSLVQQKPLQIVTSVRPLALLVEDIAGDLARVDVLLPTSASPHHYSLRVSDMQQLQGADLFVWIGPEFERFLAKPLAQKRSDAVLTASTVAGLRWPTASRASEHSHDGHSGRDMHLWLNPENGAAVMKAVTRRLGQLRPAQAPQFSANLNGALAELKQVKAEVAGALSPVRERGFGVSHDGFAHFVDAFQLEQVAAISVMPDQALGARQVMMLKKALEPAQCLVVEAGEAPDAVADWQRLFDLPVVVADPLALSPAIGSYPALIADLGKSFTTCLAGRD